MELSGSIDASHILITTEGRCAYCKEKMDDEFQIMISGKWRLHVIGCFPALVDKLIEAGEEEKG
jgi:hypothetical protein